MRDNDYLCDMFCQYCQMEVHPFWQLYTMLYQGCGWPATKRPSAPRPWSRSQGTYAATWMIYWHKNFFSSYMTFEKDITCEVLPSVRNLPEKIVCLGDVLTNCVMWNNEKMSKRCPDKNLLVLGHGTSWNFKHWCCQLLYIMMETVAFGLFSYS